MRARWVPEENFHVTVRFLGEVDALLTVNLEGAARTICGGLEPFDILLSEIGTFPSFDQPRVLWIGDRACPPFRGLASSLNYELRAHGFARDRGDAIAHVTLARIKGRPDPRLESVARNATPQAPVRILVDRLTLMQSERTPEGARYAPLFSVPFGRRS